MGFRVREEGRRRGRAKICGKRSGKRLAWCVFMRSSLIHDPQLRQLLRFMGQRQRHVAWCGAGGGGGSGACGARGGGAGGTMLFSVVQEVVQVVACMLFSVVQEKVQEVKEVQEV